MAPNAEITRQGSNPAYSDDFKLIFLMTLIALPLVFYSHSQERKASQAKASGLVVDWSSEYDQWMILLISFSADKSRGF